MPENRKDWTPFSRRETAAMVGLLVVGELFGITLSYATRTWYPKLSDALAVGCVTLLFGTLLGGIVSQLVADFDRKRVRRAAEVDFIGNVLADLKSVYDLVDRGRTVIIAHQSVKTYGDEMRTFIEARVKLRNVERALKFDERRARITDVEHPVHRMAEYLGSLTGEFEGGYKSLSRAQSVYEAKMDGAKERLKKGEAVELPANTPWDALVRLPVLADFILPTSDEKEAGDGSRSTTYGLGFLSSLDDASERLRDALIGELEDRPTTRTEGRTPALVERGGVPTRGVNATA